MASWRSFGFGMAKSFSRLLPALCVVFSGRESNDVVGLNMKSDTRHPTLAECESAGRGPENYPEAGGLPDTAKERARFEAYMRGHCWDVGKYVIAEECYDTVFVRCLYAVWRDRGALPTVYLRSEIGRASE